MSQFMFFTRSRLGTVDTELSFFCISGIACIGSERNWASIKGPPSFFKASRVALLMRNFRLGRERRLKGTPRGEALLQAGRESRDKSIEEVYRTSFLKGTLVEEGQTPLKRNNGMNSAQRPSAASGRSPPLNESGSRKAPRPGIVGSRLPIQQRPTSGHRSRAQNKHSQRR